MKHLLLTGLAFLGCVAITVPTRAQVVPVPPTVINNAAGVYVDADGKLQAREVDDKNELAAQRLRAKALAKPQAPGAITYVSLGKLLAEARSHVEAKRPLPDSLRYLSGLTQLRYVFVFPDEHDLVIAGTSEPIDASNKLQPTGKLTGRPVLHFDDLVTALRLSARGPSRMFGCSIDPHPDSLARSGQVMRDFANATRAARMNALKENLGPQQIRVFGAPHDSRLVFITIAADYKMKRMSLGLEPIPVAGIGSAVDRSRAAGNRFWFELDYAPLLVSPDADAYELRGQRLTIKCGALNFDTKGATETSKRWAKNFAARMPQLATAVSLYADLQNIADLSVVAALIRRDRLDQKAGLDLSWILSDANYKPAPVPTPRTAETLVNYTNGSIVAGGVTLNPSEALAANPESDRDGLLKGVRSRPGSDNWWATKTGESLKAPVK
jgi:hypothetical protein